jgi:hypothetical protein
MSVIAQQRARDGKSGFHGVSCIRGARRRAKSAAAERGIPLRALVSEALAEKLRANGGQD